MKRYPGVERVGPRSYRVRTKWRCPKTGRLKSIVRIVEAETQAEAATLRAAMRSEARKAEDPKPRRTLDECATSWLRSKRKETKPSTASLYATILDAYILPTLGPIFLDMLTREDAIQWRDAQDGKPASINGRLRVLRTFVGASCRDAGIPNPIERVARVIDEATDTDDDREGSCVLTADELARLLASVHKRAPQHYALVLTLAYTSCRFGEATALRWTDIDHEAGVIRVRRGQWRGHVGSTKTKTRRTIPLTPELADALVQHEAFLRAKANGPIKPWVFLGVRGGKMMHSSALRTPIAKAAEAAGLPRRPTTHWLRHTLSDLLRQATTGQIQRAITGHVTVQMAEHYSHVGVEEKREAMGRALRLVHSARAANSQESVGPGVGRAVGDGLSESPLRDDHPSDRVPSRFDGV